MRVLLQRVSSAQVDVGSENIAKVSNGLLIFLGVFNGDDLEIAKKLVKKILEFRVFPDESGKMNLSIEQVDGEILVVSQFTLAGNCQRGRRPSFDTAAPPELAQSLYEGFLQEIRNNSDLKLESGRFGADMQVSLVNDGPVSFVIDMD
ncbi:MAG: D-aminoacyl-tRNA deacylase [Bdellovibrionales bacterium]